MKKRLIKILITIFFLILGFNVIIINAVLTRALILYWGIYHKIMSILNFGIIISMCVPIIVFIITKVKKYDYKVFKKVLLHSVILFIICYSLIIKISGFGGLFADSITYIPKCEDIKYYTIDIIIALMVFIYQLFLITYPIKKLKKQNSLKGEEGNVKDDKINN